MSGALYTDREQGMVLAQFVRAHGFLPAEVPRRTELNEIAYDGLDVSVLALRGMPRKAKHLIVLAREASLSFWLNDSNEWTWSTPLSGLSASEHRLLGEFMAHVNGTFARLRVTLLERGEEILRRSVGPLLKEGSFSHDDLRYRSLAPSRDVSSYSPPVTLARPHALDAALLDFIQFYQRRDWSDARNAGLSVQMHGDGDERSVSIVQLGSPQRGVSVPQVVDDSIASFLKQGWSMVSKRTPAAPGKTPVLINWERLALVGQNALFQ